MMKKAAVTILLFALALSLGGCRVRTTLPAPEREDARAPEETSAEAETSAPVRIDAALPAQEPEQVADSASDEPDAPTEQDADAERRAFDSDASGELTPDAETPLYTPADEPTENAAPVGGDGDPTAAEADGAERTATETVPTDEAEQLGADESGEVADSVQTYYLTLLDSRLGGLFECKRLYVYWETDEDYRTVHKSSRAHQLILGAGAYDVSAKLLEENLTVDDGWVSRKNPDAVVKLVSGGALDADAAQTLCGELAARPGWEEIAAVREGRVLVLSGRLLDTQTGQVAAMVYLAKLLYPDQLADVDADEALHAMTEETFGAPYSGTYAYMM